MVIIRQTLKGYCVKWFACAMLCNFFIQQFALIPHEESSFYSYLNRNDTLVEHKITYVYEVLSHPDATKAMLIIA